MIINQNGVEVSSPSGKRLSIPAFVGSLAVIDALTDAGNMAFASIDLSAMFASSTLYSPV